MMMGARKWHFRILKVQLSPSKSLTITSQKCNFCAQKRRYLATFMRNRQQNRISFHETYHPSRLSFSKIRKIGCQDICRKINAFNLKSAPILTIRESDDANIRADTPIRPYARQTMKHESYPPEKQKTSLFYFNMVIVPFQCAAVEHHLHLLCNCQHSFQETTGQRR